MDSLNSLKNNLILKNSSTQNEKLLSAIVSILKYQNQKKKFLSAQRN
jgi:hypothetical protein